MVKDKSSSSKLVEEDCYKFADLYFNQRNIMYSHLYNSFDKLLNEDIENLLKNGDNTFFEKITEDKVIKYYFKFENIQIKPPTNSNNERIFPSDARRNNLTYSSKIVATVTQVQETTDINSEKVTTRVIGYPEHEVPIATVPIMVRSRFCSLNIWKDQDKIEDDLDTGGYFIVNGSEKVVMSLERMVENKPLVFINKDSSSTIYKVQVNSKSYDTNGMLQMTLINMKAGGPMSLKVPIFNEIPIFIMFRALGVESDKKIINYIVYDENDTDMINVIRTSLDAARSDSGNNKILSQEEAIEYLMGKMRVLKKYSDTDKEIKHKQKKRHLMHLLNNNFLPHITGGLNKKAQYIGYMVHKLLTCYLGRKPADDRDSYVNKRIDLPGTLLEELFRQYYKKMLSECNKFFKKRNVDDEKPLNIINQIKPNIIELGLKATLLTGSWGKKVGVAQMLQRLTFMYMASSLRRINAPTANASANKMTKPRHLHPTQVGFVCPVETPEGGKVGLVKNLSISGNVTIMLKSQISVLKGYLDKRLKDPDDIPVNDWKYYAKAFLNGEWLGISRNPLKLYKELKQMKYTGKIDATVSVVYDYDEREIRLYCDGGRLYRPVLRVENNKILLTKEMVRSIALEEPAPATAIKKWKEFMARYPGVVEYIDADESTFSLVGEYPHDVYNMRDRMLTESLQMLSMIKKNESDLRNVFNRRDNMSFIRYTHCDIHPTLLLGVVASNIPFCNRNQGPRNVFQYSQARQAMGIYSLSWRHRLDISYILYTPQRPLVSTRASKYMSSDKLPAGENVIVAIMCYTGYNQEDSVIMNQSAIDRGLYRCTAVKKYQTSIQKNQSTSQNDEFMKPDPTKVTGMRHGTYDKLNEKGYVPEETEIHNGDILFGKVSPIQPVGNSTKEYKDNSEVYKSHVPGVVDKVYTDIRNNEGYEMRKMRVRSERIPHIGDKMCTRAG